MDKNTNYSNIQSSVNPQGKSPDKMKMPKALNYFFLAIIFAVGIFLLYNLLLPSLFPKIIRGDLENIRTFTGPDGKVKLWIITDGTIRFSSRPNKVGEYGSKTKGMFCRTFSYVYDPLSKDVDEAFKTSYDDLPPSSSIVTEKGKIWVVTSYKPAPPEINVYNAEDYKKVMDINSFCGKSKELSAGIEDVSVDDGPPAKLRISTKDGREIIYSIPDDKFFANTIELGKYYTENDSSVSSIFTLDNELNSDKRKNLYYFTGPKYRLFFSSFNGEDFIRNKSNGFNQLSAVEILPDKVFIEGELLYTDAEIAVVLHQNSIGKISDRMLTCADKSGKELWTIQQKDLFDKMRGKEDDSMTEMSFMRTQCAAQRIGNLVAFLYKRQGAMGFDLSTGKKLWEYED